jgi:hypothetical protein
MSDIFETESVRSVIMDNHRYYLFEPSIIRLALATFQRHPSAGTKKRAPMLGKRLHVKHITALNTSLTHISRVLIGPVTPMTSLLDPRCVSLSSH